MPHCERLQYWKILKIFLVCHPTIEGVYTKKVATEKYRFTASKEA